MIIKKKIIKNFSSPFFIAEIGINHNGKLSIAKKLIDIAKKIGAHAVKFQSLKKETLMIEKIYKNKKPDFYFDKKIKSLEDVMNRISLSEEKQKLLSNYCKKKKIIFSSTPLDLDSVDFLDSLNVPFFKVASMDLNNHVLLKKIAKKNKPIILSTGFSSIKEIKESLKCIKKVNKKIKVSLLHCISSYPPADKEVNLRNIITLRKKFNLPVGFSDHTKGTSACLGAISLGACVIEKHFTLNKEMKGWDHKISADPSDMTSIIKQSKRINVMLGSYNRTISKKENIFKRNMRRSIVVKNFIKKNHLIKETDLDFKRPGIGIAPSDIRLILNKRAKKNLYPDEIIMRKNIK